MKKLTILLLLLVTSSVHADLQTLDNQALQAVEAQAGADLSLKLRLNHVDKNWNTTTNTWDKTEIVRFLSATFVKDEEAGKIIYLWLTKSEFSYLGFTKD